MSICPKCHNELALLTYEGIELLKCFECKGFWFKKGAFREVKRIGFAGLPTEEVPESVSRPSSLPSAEKEMHCPECSQPLSTYVYAYSSDIHLHRCAQCKGIWADYDALMDIEHLLASYNQSLDEAKAKALPLMLKVKEQFLQEEKAREEEQKHKKKPRFFNRLFRKKESENRIEDIFEDFHKNNDDQ